MAHIENYPLADVELTNGKHNQSYVAHADGELLDQIREMVDVGVKIARVTPSGYVLRHFPERLGYMLETLYQFDDGINLTDPYKRLDALTHELDALAELLDRYDDAHGTGNKSDIDELDALGRFENIANHLPRLRDVLNVLGGANPDVWLDSRGAWEYWGEEPTGDVDADHFEQWDGENGTTWRIYWA